MNYKFYGIKRKSASATSKLARVLFNTIPKKYRGLKDWVLPRKVKPVQSTYLGWTVNATFVVVVLFGIFLIIVAIQKYRCRKFITKLRALLKKRKEEKERENDLKFELFKHILNVENSQSDDNLLGKENNEYIICRSDSNVADASTHHCS